MPSDSPGSQSTAIDSPGSPDKVALWTKYEDVAMHFNDLIMRWRLQAIGGLAGLVTLAGFVVGDADTLLVRYRAMLILSGVLISGWVGVACIDLFYYRRLLQGAVEAILDLESQVHQISLSTRIEKKAQRGSTITPWLFYLSGLLPLVLILAWAIFQLQHLPAEAARSVSP
jgi:hypothetical protein